MSGSGDLEPAPQHPQLARPITLLPAELANQIAAGEVVERPSSVLKELMENALDAGATTIRVEVAGGGTKRVRVHDDGHGLAAPDLALALSRHATSKLTRLTDLHSLRSMGFRGEALPSIASVSRLELVSRTASAEQGFGVRVDGSATVSAPYPAAHPVGTTVCVDDLFFNTPARRKFLRTERTEQRHLEEVFKRMALARLDVSMQLIADGRTVLNLPAARDEDARARKIGRLFGRDFLRNALTIDVQVGEQRLHGWLGGPTYHRAQADCQFLYVNGRSVRDALLRHALRAAYADLVPDGRHAAYALYFELDPAKVDVNVHPTKHELRFRETRLVHDFVLRAVERALREPLVTLDSDGSGSAVADPAAPGPEVAGASVAQFGLPHGEGGGEQSPESASVRGPGFWPSDSGPVGLAGPPALAEQRVGYGHDRRFNRAGEAGAAAGGHRALAVLGGQVLLVQSGDDLLLVDLDRARRLAAWRNLRLQHGEGRLAGRPLLIPFMATVPAAVADRAESEQAGWLALGFDIRRIAPEQLSVRGVPIPLYSLEPAGWVPDLLTFSASGAASSRAPEALFAALRERLMQASGPGASLPAFQGPVNELLAELQRSLGDEVAAAPLARRLSPGDLAALLGNG